MIDLAIIAAFALGCIAGFVVRRVTNAIASATVSGFGLAIAFHLWLRADPTRGDALEGVGYFMAFAVPLGGCTLGWLASRFKRKRR